MSFAKKTMPAPIEALDGRPSPIRTAEKHFVSGAALKGPFPEHLEEVVFALGCFWGGERLFWDMPGVHVTAVGYSGGITRNPTYEEVCSGRTGHTEVVRVIYDPAFVSFTALLKTFWESHDPTQGMQQGNDGGTQYRSAIYTTTPGQHAEALKSKALYEQELRRRGYRPITTEIESAPPFFYAEEYHQQYLAKDPNGYCGIAGTGVNCPIGIEFKAAS